MARNWMQIKKNAMGGNRTHSQSLAKIADIFARTSTIMGNCRFPLYISKTKAEERRDILRAINERRMERNEWPFSGPNAEQDSLRPAIAVFRAIAERNHSRARRRFLRARCLAIQGGNGEVWEDDAHRADPSDDKGIPAESQDAPLNLPTHFSLPLRSLDPRLTV